MEELVSVIVPVYNIEDYLPRCLACLEMQTYKNLEIILVDDGSTDGSGKICDEYAAKDPRARVIHHTENRGLWAARNTGQDAAHGEYIWMPDGDDYFHKDIIKVMHEAINKDGEKYDAVLVGVSITDSYDGDTTSLVNDFGTKILTRDELIVNLFRFHFFEGVMWNKLYRRSLINDLRSNDYQRTQDWDFCFRVYMRLHNAIVLENIMYYWYQHPKSLMHSPDYHDIHMKCKIQMLYNNYMELPVECKQYGKYLLYSLYKMMMSYNEELYGSEMWPEMVRNHRLINRDTWWAYLTCREILFTERIMRLFMTCFPGIAHRLMVIRKVVPVNRIWRKVEK